MSPPPPPGDLQAASIDSLEAALTGLDIDVPAKDIVLAVRGEGAEPAKQICYATPSERGSPASTARPLSVNTSNMLVALHPSNRDGAKPSSLPPEIIDLIVDYLYDESNTLKACGVVSKSWVPRTRKHLFAHVLFNSHGSTESWRELFPDSSSSPAHCAHSLTIRSVPAIMTMSTALIRSFCHVVKFKVDTWVCDDTDEWVPLHLFGGFPPTLKSLSLSCHSVPLPRIFDLICSLPLLEDLALEYQGLKSDIKGWDTHPTSPKLTGSLDLSCENPSVIQGLLDLPDGLHFSEITISCLVENAELTMDLLSMCSDNLESLCVEYMNTGAFPSAPQLINTLSLPVVQSIMGPEPNFLHLTSPRPQNSRM